MKKISLSLLGVLFLTGYLYAQHIQDLSKADGAYPAIKQSVDKGYLSLFNDHTFRPDTTLTRKEVALIIDQLLREIDRHSLSISDTELSELNHLSESFKGTLSSLQTTLVKLDQTQGLISDEQVTIQHDMTEQELRMKKIEKRHTLMWIAIAITGILSLAN